VPPPYRGPTSPAPAADSRATSAACARFACVHRIRGGEGWLLCCDIPYNVYSHGSTHHPQVRFGSVERVREIEREREGLGGYLERERSNQNDRFYSLAYLQI